MKNRRYRYGVFIQMDDWKMPSISGYTFAHKYEAKKYVLEMQRVYRYGSLTIVRIEMPS